MIIHYTIRPDIWNYWLAVAWNSSKNFSNEFRQEFCFGIIKNISSILPIINTEITFGLLKNHLEFLQKFHQLVLRGSQVLQNFIRGLFHRFLYNTFKQSTNNFFKDASRNLFRILYENYLWEFLKDVDIKDVVMNYSWASL